MSGAAGRSEHSLPRARGRVLQAVHRTRPGFVTGALERRAGELIDAARYAEAAEVLERGVERYGTGAVSALLLAWCLHLADRQGAALDWAVRAVASEPANADAHWLHANLLFAMGRSEEAEAALLRAVALRPEDGRYIMQLAWSGNEDKAFAETRGLVERALRCSPDDAWVQHTAGRIFDHHLRHRRAHVHYARALELDPGDAAVRGDLSEVLQTRGRLSAGVRVAWQTAGAGGLYPVTLRRWSWRWYEWALRVALLVVVVDWAVRVPLPAGAVLVGVLAAGYAACLGWSLRALPRECRRDLVARGRRGFLAGAVGRVLAAGGVIGLVLLGEPSGLQRWGMLAFLVAGYAEWYWRAARISGRRVFGSELGHAARGY